MTALLAYVLVTSAFLGVAAAAAEAALRSRGRPARWVWAAALLLSATLPLLVRGLEALRPVGAAAVAPATLAPVLAPLTVGVTPSGVWWLQDQALLVFWGAVSLLLAARLFVSWISLRESARRWSRGKLEGVPVWVSRDTGPATVGILRPDIVVPRWAISLDPVARRLMIAHEREHLRALDPHLLLLGTMLLLAMPWNLVLWWQYRRLRLAVEVDCDRRVIRAERSPLAYGSLLLEVGRHRAGFPVLSVALAEGRSFLERRIRFLGSAGFAGSARRALGLSVLAAGLVVLAMCTPGPFAPDAPAPDIDLVTVEEPGRGPAPDTSGWMEAVQLKMQEDSIERPPSPVLREPAAAPAARERQEIAAAELSDGPTFTPYEVSPELRNRDEVMRALERYYPPLLRDAGIGGSSILWFYIDESGRVVDVRINRSSGHHALDQAALAVAEIMEFAPAVNRDRPVPVWVSLPITFRAG